MQLTTKPYLIILTSVILLFALFACLRQLGFTQITAWGEKNEAVMKGILLTAFLVSGAAAVPVFLKAFLAMQSKIGNGDLPFVRSLHQYAMQVIYAVWIVFGLGLGIALPVMIKKGMLSNNNITAVTAAATGLYLPTYALYPIKKDGKWGYLNNKLEMAIPARFSRAEDFSEGLAAVADHSKDATGQAKELYGYINPAGKLVVDYTYDKAFAFSEGLAAVVKDGKFGYIDKAGTVVVPPQYEDASSFSEGLAVVKSHGKNGFIDKTGRMVIAPRFLRACWVSVFSEGLAPVYTGEDGAGYIDHTGHLIIPANFSYVSAFSEGLALVQPKGSRKYGYINRKGEMVIEPQYELSLPFSEGVATVKISRADGSYFFRIIGKDGKTIADNLQYSFVGVFREGLAGVESSDLRWGFIDQRGREVIAPRFASVRLFQNGLSMIQTGSLFTTLQTGYIDKTGNRVTDNKK